MNALRQRLRPAGRLSVWMTGAAWCLMVTAGCDLGLDESSNRYEKMGEVTAQLAKVLQQVTNEASARQHLPEIQKLGDQLREIQKGILGAESDNPLGMPKATNVRQAKLFNQVATGVVHSLERIRQADSKAGELVDQALQGIYWQ
jgi:hypothetical protein